MATEKITNLALAKNLSRLMQDQNLTQLALANGIGVTRGAIQNYLKGRIPRGLIAQRLAQFLGVTWAELLKEGGASNTQPADTLTGDKIVADLASDSDYRKVRAAWKLFGIDKMNTEDLIAAFEQVTKARQTHPPGLQPIYMLLSSALIKELRRRLKV